MAQKKLYGVKEKGGRVWKTELNVNTIAKIAHYGAGSEMCNDEIDIEFVDGTYIRVDYIISE